MTEVSIDDDVTCEFRSPVFIPHELSNLPKFTLRDRLRTDKLDLRKSECIEKGRVERPSVPERFRCEGLEIRRVSDQDSGNLASEIPEWRLSRQCESPALDFSD